MRKSLYRFYLFRKIFWDLKAKEMYTKWGNVRGDFETLTGIIKKYRIKRILDFGCGNGRLFQLYKKLPITKVVGQDISKNALKIAARRKGPNVTLTNTPIMDLDFPKYHFDLIVSCRVLQHIPRSEMGGVISKLTVLGQKVFIDEINTESEENELYFMFKYDYINIFKKHNFRVLQSGYPKADWGLFAKK